MLTTGEHDKVLEALKPKIGSMRRDQLTPRDILLYRLWVVASRSEPYDEELGNMIGHFIRQHIRSDQQEAAAALKDRLSEWPELYTASARKG
jgi:hypothetical protein